jgi:AAA domain-containing protein
MCLLEKKMNKDFVQIRKLVFLGPDKEVATLSFKKGLNVVCGASDTGKSFLIEAIDFMLGGSKDLRDIPERVGYDRVRLAIKTSSKESFTFERSSESGGFKLFDGILEDQLQVDGGVKIKPKHGHGATDNISGWLLNNVGLLGKRIRKNAQGETRSLSFRDLARLVVVDEREIIKNTSPFLTSQFTTKTVEYSTLKLLLTGADDSAIVPAEKDERKIVGTAAKIELLDQMISDLNDEIENKNIDAEELEEQMEKLLTSIERKRTEMSSFQSNLNESIIIRRDLLSDKENIKNRISEINQMLERFKLLKEHYLIDVDRLIGVEETGSLFVHYEKVPCPLCGSLTDNVHNEEACEGNVESVVIAAKKEIEKILSLMADLANTISELGNEKEALLPELNIVEKKYKDVDEEIRVAVSPDFQNSQLEYSALMEKKNQVVLGLDTFSRFKSLEQKRKELDATEENDIEEMQPTKLSKATLSKFSKMVETILIAWDFPDASNVYFDEIEKDFVISGKPRGSRGKGLRAITHAAVTLGLMEYCRENSLPHPGFIVMDSPLLASYKPEGDDDSLRGSNLKDKFYAYLIEKHSESQVIIIENEHPPELYEKLINLHVFTKNPHENRFGFFPISTN